MNIIKQAEILGRIVTAALKRNTEEVVRLSRLLSDSEVPPPITKDEPEGEPEEEGEEPDERDIGQPEEVEGDEPTDEPEGEEPDEPPLEGEPEVEDEEGEEGEPEEQEPTDEPPEAEDEPTDEPEEQEPPEEGEEPGDGPPVERPEGEEPPEAEDDEPEDEPTEGDEDRPSEPVIREEEKKERDKPEDKPEDKPTASGSAMASLIYPFPEEHRIEYEQIAMDARDGENPAAAGNSVGVALSILAEEIANGWEMCESPGRVSRIGAEKGRIGGLASLRRIATGHPLPFEGDRNNQAFRTLEVSVLLDRSGSMNSPQEILDAGGEVVFSGSRWQCQCLTAAAIEEAIRLVGREDEIRLRTFSWSDAKPQGRPITYHAIQCCEILPDCDCDNRGAVIDPHKVYQGITEKAAVQAGIDCETNWDNSPCIIEHHTGSLLNGCTLDKFNGRVYTGAPPWAADNPIGPTLEAISEYLQGEECDADRRCLLLFSDGSAGMVWRSSADRFEWPGLDDLQDSITAAEVAGFGVGIIDFSGGDLHRENTLNKLQVVEGSMEELAEQLGRLAAE